nr:hypothetical protein PoMZ_03681 [Ipomoea batatas]
MVSRLHLSHTFTNTFHYTAFFMTKDTWEETFRILQTPRISIGVAESSEENLNSDFPGLRRSHLHILDHQWLVGFPGHRRFTSDDLTLSGHESEPQN